MINYKDNQLITDENSAFSIAAMSVLGDREEQQDCFGYDLKHEEGLVVVCDGMGGHEGGKIAAELAVAGVLDEYASGYAEKPPIDLLIGAAQRANTAICGLKNDRGEPLKAGSTLAAIFIRKKQLIWCSVGDSRAYLLRRGEFVQLTQDHNYLTVLRERRNAGLISEAAFAIEKARGEALISFLGIGELKLIDYSEQPFALRTDDKIVIMSDGLYKVVPEEEIARVVDNFNNIGEAIGALEIKAKGKAKNSGENRDNTTVALIKIK